MYGFCEEKFFLFSSMLAKDFRRNRATKLLGFIVATIGLIILTIMAMAQGLKC